MIKLKKDRKFDKANTAANIEKRIAGFLSAGYTLKQAKNMVKASGRRK